MSLAKYDVDVAWSELFAKRVLLRLYAERVRELFLVAKYQYNLVFSHNKHSQRPSFAGCSFFAALRVVRKKKEEKIFRYELRLPTTYKKVFKQNPQIFKFLRFLWNFLKKSKTVRFFFFWSRSIFKNYYLLFFFDHFFMSKTSFSIFLLFKNLNSYFQIFVTTTYRHPISPIYNCKIKYKY